MSVARNSHSKLMQRLSTVLWGVTCLCICGVPAHAHTPQDAIDSLHVSPDYDNDSTLFIIVQNNVLRSLDRGASWKQLVNGLDSPNVLSDIEISPEFSTDHTLFVSTDGGGVYQSADRGQSWQRFNKHLSQQNIGMLLVSAGPTEQVVLAAGSSRGLFIHSGEDEGWQRAMSDDVQITALKLARDNSSIFALAGDSTGGLWKSDPEMRNWRRFLKLDNDGAITAIAQSSADFDRLLVGTENTGLRRTDLNGRAVERLSMTWPARELDCLGRNLADPVPDLHIRDIEIDATDPGSAEIHVTTWNNAVHVSYDDGETWQLRGNGISCDNQADSYVIGVPHYRDLEHGGVKQGDWFLAGFDGLYRSEDAGESWVQFETLPVSLIRGLSVSHASDAGYGLAVTTYGGGAYISHNQGESWSIANDGLVTTRLADVEFSPTYSTDGRIFGLSKERILSSDDITNGWIASDLVYRGWRRRIGAGLERRLGFSSKFGTKLFLSDSERTRVWPMQIELSPEFEKDQTIVLGLRRHGVWISENGGDDWSRNWHGPTDYITALQISPDFPNDRSVFAGIRGAGIYVSTDGSDTWQASNTGFRYLQQVQATTSPNYVIDPPLHIAVKDVLMVISPDFAKDQTLFASSAAGLFKSVDAAQSWVTMPVPESLQDVPVNAIGISPAFDEDNILLASFKGRGLYRSTDGGIDFQPIGGGLLKGNYDLKLIEFSPDFRNDGTIFGATDEVLLLSRDRGDTWDVVRRPIRYEDWRGEDRGPIRFSGEWTRETGTQYSASTQATSDRPGAQAMLNFLGTTIVWRGSRGPDGGLARVFIDGEPAASADLYKKESGSVEDILSISVLEDGPHELLIEVSAEKNAESSGYRIAIDSLDVLHD